MNSVPESPGSSNGAARGGPRRVFIVGCRRSGTTWTMLLLAQHPEVVALQQIDFFRRLAHFGRWFETEEEFGSCVLASRTGARVQAERTRDGLAKLSLRKALEPHGFHELLRPVVETIYGDLAACNPDARVVVEQTPENVRIWEEILKVLPDASFLHVVRDPRAVFASHKSAATSWADPTRFSHDAIDVAREWSAEVESGQHIPGATAGYLQITYEALKHRPIEELGRIFAWMGLAADRELCERAVAACSIEKMRSTSHAPQGFFRQGQAEGWKAELSRAEVRAVEYVCGERMRALGYELQNAWPVAKPARLSLREAKERAKRSLRRWAWDRDSTLRRGASRVLRSFPGLRKVLLRNLRRS
jgi:hypothetical protein